MIPYLNRILGALLVLAVGGIIVQSVRLDNAQDKYTEYKAEITNKLVEAYRASEQETIKACDKGTKKHNYLETAIKTCSGYKLNANGFINDRIYTIDDIVGSHKYGKLNLEYFVKTGIREKYPDIFSLIAALVMKGYHIYAEIGVYDSQNLVSGLIDILLIRDKEFIILDWKTNKAPIRDRKSTRLNSSHSAKSRMPSSA